MECFSKLHAAPKTTTFEPTTQPTTETPVNDDLELSSPQEKANPPNFSENERLSEVQRKLFEHQIDDDLTPHVQVRRLRFA